jgi:hypothetical protein
MEKELQALALRLQARDYRVTPDDIALLLDAAVLIEALEVAMDKVTKYGRRSAG